jgi:hypothetical protein
VRCARLQNGCIIPAGPSNRYAITSSESSSLLAPDIYSAFVTPLNALGIRYFITGSTAGIAYGEPRMTNDIDMVVELYGRDVARFVAAFPDSDYYCPPADVLAIEVRRGQRGHCTLIAHANGFKADIYLAYDELHQWAMGHRRDLRMSGMVLPLAPPEYVILRKLEYFREGGSQKHMRDIRGMLAVSADIIDVAFVEQHVARMGLSAEWAAAQKSSGAG